MRLLVATALLVCLGAGGLRAEPNLRLTPKQFDFGIIPKYSTVYLDVWLSNAGADTIRIEKISTGCKCAAMPLERDVLAPGDSVRTRLSWEHGRTVGAASRIPRIQLQGVEKDVAMTLKGSVIAAPDSARPVSVKPFKCELSRAGEVSVDSTVVRLWNHSAGDVDVLLLANPDDFCTLSLPAGIPSGNGADLVVKVRPEYADQEFETSITLGFSDPRESHVTIPIRRKVY